MELKVGIRGTECISLIKTLKATYEAFQNYSHCDFDNILRLTEKFKANHDIVNRDVTTSRSHHHNTRENTIKSNYDLRADSRAKLSLSRRYLWNYESVGISLPGSSTFGMKDLLKTPSSLYGIEICDAEYTAFTQHIRRKVDEQNKKFPSLI